MSLFEDFDFDAFDSSQVGDEDNQWLLRHSGSTLYSVESSTKRYNVSKKDKETQSEQAEMPEKEKEQNGHFSAATTVASCATTVAASADAADMYDLLSASGVFEDQDSGEKSVFRRPLSLVESTKNPITARNDTVEMLRVSGKNVANAVIGESWSGNALRQQKNGADRLLQKNQAAKPIAKQTAATNAQALSNKSASLDWKLLSQRESVQQRRERQNLQELRFAERESALLRGEQVFDVEQRAKAHQMIAKALLPFVTQMSDISVGETDGEKMDTKADDNSANRFFSIALGLKSLGLPNLAGWLFQPDNATATGANSIDLETKVYTVLHVMYEAAGKAVRVDQQSKNALSVPMLIGSGRNAEEMMIWHGINSIVYFSDNLSAFEYDRRRVSCLDDSQLHESEIVVLSEQTLQQTEQSVFFRLTRALDRYWTRETCSPAQLMNMSRIYPLTYRALAELIQRDELREQTVVMLAHIMDNSMLPFVEFALSDTLFTRQSIDDAINCCYEKFTAFERALTSHIVDSAAETYEIFWFSDDVVQFEERMKLLVTLQSAERDASGRIVNAPLARLRANLQQCAKMHRVTIVKLIDQLRELHSRNMMDCLQPHLERDWEEWREEARHEDPNISKRDLILGCPHTRTILWLDSNTGLTDTQREMVAQNIGALQRRLSASLDAYREPVHEKFVENGLAVDDSNPSHKVPLPILVCYERTCPNPTDGDVDYSAVLVPQSGVFRAYGVFLYTRSPKQSPSRFALMTWLSPPFAGETVVAFTPFCQGLIDHYISRSDRTSAPGYNGLKYYSAKHRKFLPIERLLGRREPIGAAGVVNRMQNSVALELRRNANLRQVKSLKLPKPPSIGKSRDSLYLAYQVNDDTRNGVWRNYVHPGAAARLWDLGYMEALEQCKQVLLTAETADKQALIDNLMSSLSSTHWQKRAESLEKERQGSLAILSTWRENFFDSSAKEGGVGSDDDDDDGSGEKNAAQRAKKRRKNASKGDKAKKATALASKKRKKRKADSSTNDLIEPATKKKRQMASSQSLLSSSMEQCASKGAEAQTVEKRDASSVTTTRRENAIENFFVLSNRFSPTPKTAPTAIVTAEAQAEAIEKEVDEKAEAAAEEATEVVAEKSGHKENEKVDQQTQEKKQEADEEKKNDLDSSQLGLFARNPSVQRRRVRVSQLLAKRLSK